MPRRVPLALLGALLLTLCPAGIAAQVALGQSIWSWTAAEGQPFPPTVISSGLASGVEASTEARPPLNAEFMALQGAAGMIGGLSGSFLMILPFAAGEVRSRNDSSNAAIVAALLGYYTGSALGVQLYSRHHGLRGSWKWTFGGAALGALGGPAFLITVPAGSTVGFNQTRYYPAGRQPL